MKIYKYFLILMLTGCCSDLSAQIKMDSKTAQCGIKFSTDFTAGSLDSVGVKEIMMVSAQMEMPFEKLEFDLFSKSSIKNQVGATLPPGSRWYFFKMTGVRNKEITLNMHDFHAFRPFYSYDGKNYIRFSEQECDTESSFTKKYDCDSVFIAGFIPQNPTSEKIAVTKTLKCKWRKAKYKFKSQPAICNIVLVKE